VDALVMGLSTTSGVVEEAFLRRMQQQLRPLP
jgi:hypothetical protein